MDRQARQPDPQPALGDRAVVIAGVLAIVVVTLFGVAPVEEPSPTRAAQSAHR